MGLPAEECNSDNQHHKANGNDNEIIADFEDCPLEVADGLGLFHEPGRFPEGCVPACGVDKGITLTAPHHGSREDGLTCPARNREGLAGQGRLVDLERISFDDARIGRHDITKPNPDHIPRYKFAGRHSLPLATTPDFCLEGKGLL